MKVGDLVMTAHSETWPHSIPSMTGIIINCHKSGKTCDILWETGEFEDWIGISYVKVISLVEAP